MSIIWIKASDFWRWRRSVVGISREWNNLRDYLANQLLMAVRLMASFTDLEAWMALTTTAYLARNEESSVLKTAAQGLTIINPKYFRILFNRMPSSISQPNNKILLNIVSNQWTPNLWLHNEVIVFECFLLLNPNLPLCQISRRQIDPRQCPGNSSLPSNIHIFAPFQHCQFSRDYGNVSAHPFISPLHFCFQHHQSV